MVGAGPFGSMGPAVRPVHGSSTAKTGQALIAGPGLAITPAMKFVMAVALGLGSLLQDTADPASALRDAYAHQFENEWVKIVRVTYAPFVTLPDHDHPTRATAFVYLTDSGPVIFRHTGKDYHAVTRPPVKARAFRLAKAMEEHHEVENTTGQASEFLRVEFKTEPRTPQTFAGRYPPRAAVAGQSKRLEVDHEQVRIARLFVPAGGRVDVTATEHPALLIVLDDGPRDARLARGQEHFVPAGARETIGNAGTETVELLRFDFKTNPVR